MKRDLRQPAPAPSLADERTFSRCDAGGGAGNREIVVGAHRGTNRSCRRPMRQINVETTIVKRKVSAAIALP